ncbi:MAG: hypothetical protein Unbinned8622contig1003_10 [Prokaryotic dsDNA virus sp.]|nr:MAG: hypothetical protein Unbinned8622contig1003_10 [Prokaryotic dsDNA virus sp.]|tara:strand:- start:2792 stop:3487 length:696 start_codon:yes stop_codon:yes gene_type:complete
MSRPNLSQRKELRKKLTEKRKATQSARVVHKGQRATLNGKRVIADGKGNWMPESHYDRYSPNFRKGKPVGTYVVGRDRSKPTPQGETAAQRERRIFPPTRGAKRSTQGRTDAARLRQDERRMIRALEQGGGRTGEAYVGTGKQSTRPTKPAKATKPTKVAKPAGIKPAKPAKPAKRTAARPSNANTSRMRGAGPAPTKPKKTALREQRDSLREMIARSKKRQAEQTKKKKK